MRDYDPDYECENCFQNMAEVMNEGVAVCRRCDKELKRQARKAENKRRRREERDETY